MWSKTLHIFLNLLNSMLLGIYTIVRKMTSTEGTNGPDTGVYIDEMYTFKAFKYKELKPVRGCTGFVVGMNNNTVVPYPRSGHRIGADSANFYSFGGYNPLVPNSVETITDDYYVQSFPLFQELWKFNYASRQWTKYPNSRSLPLELASNALLLDGNCLMVCEIFSNLFDLNASFSRFMVALVLRSVSDVVTNCTFSE